MDGIGELQANNTIYIGEFKDGKVNFINNTCFLERRIWSIIKII